MGMFDSGTFAVTAKWRQVALEDYWNNFKGNKKSRRQCEKETLVSGSKTSAKE